MFFSSIQLLIIYKSTFLKIYRFEFLIITIFITTYSYVYYENIIAAASVPGREIKILIIQHIPAYVI